MSARLDPKLEKKIKKNIYAKPQKIKAIFPSGFSDVALSELQTILTNLWFPQKYHSEYVLLKNEIIVNNIHMFSIMELLLRSKTLADVRLILFEGKVVGKNTFAKKCQDINWDFFLTKNIILKIKVNSVASKAFHETGLKEIVSSILQDQVKEIVSGENTNETTTLYVDFYKDRLTLSISLAGAPLYKRGYRNVLSASAPLREDIAASCIQKAFSQQNFIPDKIIIPFSGTGTFAFEYIQYACQLANLFREFAFEKMPLFQKNTFNFLLKKAKNNFQGNSPLVFSIDNSAAANKSFQENVMLFNDCMQKNGLTLPLNIKQLHANFQEIDVSEFLENKKMDNVFLPLNPPYGIRLNKSANTTSLYKQIAIKINEIFKIIKQEKKGLLGFILCPTEASWMAFCKQLKDVQLETYHFNQGGLDIRVCQFSNRL